MPSALLIDLDGTLIDSEPCYKRTEVLTMNEFGVPITLEEMEEFTGVTFPVWLRALNERYGAEIQREAFMEVYRPRMENLVASEVQMFEDALAFIDRHRGVPAALVTSSMKWYVDSVLRRFPEIGDAVETIVCEADVQRGKPDPEPYLIACQRLKVAPMDAVVFEDAPNGVKSGVAAGCQVYGIDRHGLGHLHMATSVVRSLDSITLPSP
ncbi:MAG: HAD family phosphatase [Armatimonadetes bacterium]|nr:HAD family phosphatase [Armatimonadota bacterium]